MTGSDELRQARELLERMEQRVQNGDPHPTHREFLQLYRDVLSAVEACEGQSARRHARLLAHLSLLDRRLLEIERSRPFQLWNATAARAIQWYRRAGQLLLGSPVHGVLEPYRKGAERAGSLYAEWSRRQEAALPSFEAHRSISEAWAYTPLISVIIPVYQSEAAWLDAALQSVEGQSYRPWEACIAIDGEPQPALLRMIEGWAEREARVRVARLSERRGISAASNAAAGLATGEYLGFLDHDDTLSPFALHYMVEALQGSRAGLLYSDQDRLDATGRRVQPVFKPDWSPSLLQSCMYIGHFLLVSHDLFRAVGGLRSELDGAQDHDLALRISEQPVEVRHVPRVLYHWRIHEHSTAGFAAKPFAEDAGRKAVESALDRTYQDGVVERGVVPHTCDVRRRVPDGAALTIIICSRTQRLAERCIRSIQATVQKVKCSVIVVQHEDRGPNPRMREALERLGARVLVYTGEFNFAEMNNTGAREASAPNLLFLNDDVYATAGGWCERIVAELHRPEVAIAGAVLRYPSGAIQHSGVVLGLGDGVGHAGRFQFASDLWPWLTVTREVSAVTGACLGIRTELFRNLGGFDAGFPNNYNDVDLCLRAGSTGLSVMCLSAGELVHEECATRAGVTHLRERERFYERWAGKLSQSDPFYSPSLSRTEQIGLNFSNAVSLFTAE